MADNKVAEYIVKLSVDTSDTVKFSKEIKSMETRLKELNVITDKNSTLLGYRWTPSIRRGKKELAQLSLRLKDTSGRIHNTTVAADVNSKALVKNTTTISSMNKATLSMGQEMSKLAKRALLVIPIWLALRGAITGVLRTISEGAKYWVDLQSNLARAEAVTTTTTLSMGKAMDVLRTKAEQFGVQNKGSAQDVIEAYYRMATSGLVFKDAIEAAIPATKLAIATYGDVATVAKTVSAVYRLLGDTIEGATTRTEKMKVITDVLGTAWTNNELEINEVSQAIANFGTQAKRFNLSFTETIALLATSHQGLIKAGRAGRLTGRIFDDLSSKLGEVKKILGLTFDPAEELDWFNILTQIIEKFKQLETSSPQVVEQMNALFNIRARREFGLYVELYDKLNKNLDNFRNNASGMVDKLLEIRNATPEAQFENLRQNINKLASDFITGATNSDDFVEGLKKINTTLEGMSFYFTAAGAALSQFVKNLAALPKIIDTMNTPKDKKSFFDISALSEAALHNISRIGEGGASFKDIWNDFLSEFEAPKEQVNRTIDAIENEMVDIGDAVDIALEKARKRMIIEYQKTADELEDQKEKLEKELTTKTDGKIIFDVDVERKLKGVKELAELNELQAKGASETALAYQKINNWIEKYNQENELSLSNSEKLNILLSIREENWEKISNQLRLSKKQQEDLINLAKTLNDLDKERLALLSKFRGAFEKGLSDVIVGDINFKEFGDRLKDTITRAYADAFSQAATKKIFDFTGIGDSLAAMGVDIRHIFEGQTGKIKSAYDYGADVTYKSIVKGFSDATGDMGAKDSAQVVAKSGGFKIPGLGTLSDFLKKPRGKEGGAFGSGSVAGRATGAVMLADLYKLKGTGNVFGGAAQGAMAGGMLGGPVGAVLGGLYGLFRGGQSKTTSETRTQTMQISSKIQVTNQSLEFVNRNLIALKSSFDTFVMPESAYFSQSRGIADDFSVSSRR